MILYIRTAEGRELQFPMHPCLGVALTGEQEHVNGYSLLGSQRSIAEYLQDAPPDGNELSRYAFIEVNNLDEYIRCCMYEGGEFCGLHFEFDGASDCPPDWTWALVPESTDDVTHIEEVIVPYGRYQPGTLGED